MANTFDAVDSTGASFPVEDTPDNRQKVTSQGYTINEGIGHQVGEFARGLEESISSAPAVNYNPLTWVEHGALAGAANLLGAKPDSKLAPAPTLAPNQFAVKDSEGNHYAVEDTPDNRQKVKDQGYAIASAAEFSAANDPRLQGARGAAKTYLGSVGDEYLWNIPAKLPKSASGGLAELIPEEMRDVDRWKAIKAQHQTAADLGTTAAIVAGMMTPGLDMAGPAGKAESLATRALAKVGVEGESLAGKALLGAAQHGARGAVYGAPQALGDVAFASDPKAAGEALATYVGIGALLGGGSPLARRAISSATEQIASRAEKLQGSLQAKVDAKIAEEAADKAEPTLADKAKEAVQGKVGEVIGKGVEHAATFVGGAIGGGPGALIGKGVGKALGKAAVLAGDVETQLKFVKLARKVGEVVGRGLDSVPDVVDSLADASVKRGGSRSVEALGRLTGLKESDQQKQYDELRKKLADATADPQTTDKVAAVSGLFDTPRLYVGVPSPNGKRTGGPGTNFDTPLSPVEEAKFQAWKTKYAPNDSGQDYDLRGAFLAGLKPDDDTGHWPDTFKKPNHSTFSVESQYAKYDPSHAGHWVGDKFLPGLAISPADQLTLWMHGTLAYLQSQLPKPPPPSPFSGPQTWAPPAAELMSFSRKAHVVSDPFVLLDELNRHTLTRDHVEAAEAVYPTLLGEMRRRAVARAYEPDAPVLHGRSRSQLSLFLGQSIDSVRHGSFQSYYAEDPGSGGSGGGKVKKMGTLPGTKGTPGQTIGMSSK